MISIVDVHKRFGNVHAVRGVSFDVPTGQVVGLLGPNGAGKTTTVRMLGGAIPPTSGSLTVDGLDCVDRSLDVRKRLGYLPESAPIYREMRVRDYLVYRARLFGLTADARRSAIARSMDLCRVSDVASQRVGTLSRGYRQRVGLASVLLHDPKVLILDEPTNGLDPAQIAETRKLIRDLAGTRTTLVVSHILPEVERCCDRIILFARGRIHADGPPGALISALPGAGRYTLEARPFDHSPAPSTPHTDPRRALLTLPGVISVESSDAGEGWSRCLVEFSPSAGDQRETIARACAAAGLLVRELRAQGATLEEVYLRLVAYAGEAPDTGAAPAPPPPPATRGHA